MISEITADSAKRLNFHDGMFLNSALMTIEQQYFIAMNQLQNQMLYTPGVLQGMKPAKQNNNVTITSGGGVDSKGHFLVFSGNGSNVVSIPANTISPCAIYAVYPDTGNEGNVDVINMAAQMQVGDIGSPPQNSIILALVSHDDGVVTDVVDKREPVTSKLPADLNGDGIVKSPGVELDNILHGSELLSADKLAKTGESKEIEVYFLAGHGAAFTVTPQIVVTPQLDTKDSIAGCFSVTVSKADTARFSITVTTLKNLPQGVTMVDLNWMAFAKGV